MEVFCLEIFKRPENFVRISKKFELHEFELDRVDCDSTATSPDREMSRKAILTKLCRKSSHRSRLFDLAYLIVWQLSL